MTKQPYQTNYLGITSFDYDQIFKLFSDYFCILKQYLENVNTPCLKCNDIKSIKDDAQVILHSYGYSVYKYGDNFLISMQMFLKGEIKELFITTDEIPQVIKDVIDVYYADITSDEQIPPFTIKGSLLGNQICFWLDRYNNLTIYKQIDEGHIYSTMSVSDKKKFEYRAFLYRQAFTFKSKSNCSC